MLFSVVTVPLVTKVVVPCVDKALTMASAVKCPGAIAIVRFLATSSERLLVGLAIENCLAPSL